MENSKIFDGLEDIWMEYTRYKRSFEKILRTISSY